MWQFAYGVYPMVGDICGLGVEVGAPNMVVVEAIVVVDAIVVVGAVVVGAELRSVTIDNGS